MRRPHTQPSTLCVSTICGRTSIARAIRGKTWTEITSGIPENENVNAVREDPKRKGLLFAGTERAVYVSFDDWRPLAIVAAEHAGDVGTRPD